MLTKERLDELFTYNRIEGAFYRKKRIGTSAGRITAGRRAGYISSNGYRIICIDYKDNFEHNLVWLYEHGTRLPKGKEIDHINRIKTDNRIENLREVTRSLNNANMKVRSDNTCGFRGVHFDKARNKYAVQIRNGGKTKNIGRYKTLEVAALVALVAQIDAWGTHVAIHNN